MLFEALTYSIPLLGLAGRIRKHQKRRSRFGVYRGPGKAMHMRGPKELDKYYTKCMDRYHKKEYCARVAWSIYCAHVNPKYPGCTKYGKKWGKPYSRPISKRRLSGFEDEDWTTFCKRYRPKRRPRKR